MPRRLMISQVDRVGSPYIMNIRIVFSNLRTHLCQVHTLNLIYLLVLVVRSSMGEVKEVGVPVFTLVLFLTFSPC